MTGTNHIAGGLVFTGIFASFWDVNIFSDYYYLGMCVFGSLLPDIDHTKTVLGKMFYPLAKWLDRNYGHRTITHSLVFLVSVVAVSCFIESSFSDNFTFSIILFFSVFSHFVLDMVTVQGIPLLYPFKRNPCVIPGNPQSRIRTNDKRAEAIAFFLFAVIGLSCQSLFANGFWTSYNRAFGTVKHVYSEFRNSANFIGVDYAYSRNGVEYKNSGIVLEAQQNRFLYFNGRGISTIDKADKLLTLEYTKPFPTNIPYRFENVVFNDVSVDSLNRVLDYKIVSGSVVSNVKFYKVGSSILDAGYTLNLKNDYDIDFSFIKDSAVDNSEKILKLKGKINQEVLKRNKSVNEKLVLTNELRSLRNRLKYAESPYWVNRLQNEILEVEKTLSSFKVYQVELSGEAEQIALLEHQEQEKIVPMFSGELQILDSRILTVHTVSQLK